MKPRNVEREIQEAAKQGNYRALAACLNDKAADLIKQILDKHMDTVLRELHEQVKARNAAEAKLAKVRETVRNLRGATNTVLADSITAILGEDKTDE